MLTTFNDTELLLDAMRAGARGPSTSSRTSPLDSLLDPIRTLARGGTYRQPALTDRPMQAVHTDQHRLTGVPNPPPLTGRERDVLQLAAIGLSNVEIADALYLAAGTVKNHMSNVLVKLGVRDSPKPSSEHSNSASSTPTVPT